MWRIKDTESYRRKMVKKITKQFCKETTIHGLWYIAHGVIRLPWCLIVTVAITVCLWQCGLNLKAYLSYDVQTKTTTEYFSNLEFPAITFCPEVYLKASRMSKLSQFIGLMVATINVADEQKRKIFSKDMSRSCRPKGNVSLDTVSAEMRTILDELDNGTIYSDPRYYVLFQDVFLKCYWKSRDFPCSDAFINHISTYGTCYSFNRGNEIALQFINEHAGNGLNLSNYDEATYQINTTNTGLRLLVKINQKEHCVASNDMKRGSGLWFRVHGKNIMPYPELNTFSALSQGYDYRISLQKTRIVRKTENLDRCLSTGTFSLTPNSTTYLYDMCRIQCLTEHVIKMCRCLPFHVKQYYPYFLKKAIEYGIKNETFNICATLEDVKCTRLFLDTFIQNGFKYFSNCRCPPPCEEDGYQTQITNSLLFDQRVKYETLVGNMSVKEFRKNFLTITFSFGSMSADVTVETQAFTIQDLFTYFGNNIGLFLGMSFQSPFELLFLVGYISVALLSGYRICICRCLNRKTAVHQIHIPQPVAKIGCRRNALTDQALDLSHSQICATAVSSKKPSFLSRSQDSNNLSYFKKHTARGKNKILITKAWEVEETTV